MLIDGIHLSEGQTKIIKYIYSKLKQAFSDVKYQERRSILGIGEDGKRLMCYFLFNHDGFCIKFKDKPALQYVDNDNVDIDKDIEETIELFKKYDFTLKKNASNNYSNGKSKAYNFKNSILNNLDLLEVEQKYKEALLALDNSYDIVSFERCSQRLKNALFKNKIFSIGDLRLIDIIQLFQFKNFGARCFYELCEFLLNVKDMSLTLASKESELAKQKLEMLKFIQSSRDMEINIDTTTAFADCSHLHSEYECLYIEWINYFARASQLKLSPREQAVFFLRIGIKEEQKTLQEIGDKYSVTRERIRQIMCKVIKKLKTTRTSTPELIQSEYDKCKLLEKFKTIPFAGFLAYLCFEVGAYQMMRTLCILIFKNDEEFEVIKHELNKGHKREIKLQFKKERVDKFNKSIYDLICFARQRTITEDDFARLKTERHVNVDMPLLEEVIVDNQSYQCESFLEKSILENFLRYKTFKYIKTQSLKIPYKNGFYYPDFQCLTHDNKFVIIEIKPLMNMCENKNIEKFKALKTYCEKYGFGYMVIDNRLNEFYHINDNNDEFNKQILNRLNKDSSVSYKVYKTIFKNTNATIKNLLSLIKNDNIQFSLPFLLTQ